MSLMFIDSDTLSDIADAIRTKTGGTNTMTPLEMPTEIANIPSGGGSSILSGTSIPTSALGSDGQIYLKYFNASAFPSGYKITEYVEFNNNQYFDTGISANTANLRVVAEIAVTSIITEAFWGGDWATNGYFFMAYNGKFRWHSGGKSIDALNIVANQWYQVETNKSEVIIDGTTYSLSSPSGTDVSSNLSIGTTTSNSQGAKASMKVKSMQIYSGTTLLADYVPVVDSNNVACLYDVVNSTTIYSAGVAFGYAHTYGNGTIMGAYLKVSGTWQDLIYSDINDVSL